MTKVISFVNKKLLQNKHLFVCHFLHICHLNRFIQAFPNTLLFCCCHKSELVIDVTCFASVIKLNLFCYYHTNRCSKVPQTDALKYTIWPIRDKKTQIDMACVFHLVLKNYPFTRYPDKCLSSRKDFGIWRSLIYFYFSQHFFRYNGSKC
jgi:hypothetical protein